MRIASYVLPSVSIIALLLVITGVFPFIIFLLLFLFNLFLIGLFLKKSNRIHTLVSRKQLFLSSFEQLVGSFEKEQFKSDVMSAIKEKLCARQGSVAIKIKELNNIISAFDNRLNLFVGLILNGFLLWDFHCIMKLEKWRRSAESNLPVWLNLLGKADGLNSLANYSFNNPDNSYPEAVKNGPVLEAFRLGHPLLKKNTRVCNDFSVLKRGQVFIITGANMAGKSTFLRTVAVNMVLGMTGAPVCAEKMRLTPLKLFTSMRTVDSLSHNESYFYAELKRLKALKERLEKGEDIFFILDEILKGTNSTDKSLGSKQFLRRVIDLGGTGLIATHDISLGEMEVEYPGNVVNKCFEIEIDGENICFDYLLREGITRKMNAAALMRQMGIA
jgi:DNA mismatch repair ATPase MutS